MDIIGKSFAILALTVLPGVPVFCAPLAAAAPAASPTTVTDSIAPTAVAYSAKKIFLQVGAVEKIKGNKYLLRKKAASLDFFVNDTVKVFYRGQTDITALKEGQFVTVKGAKNSNTIIANTVSIYNEMEVFKSTKEDDDDGQAGISMGTVIKRQSDCDEYDKFSGRASKPDSPDAAAPQTVRPFFIRTADNRVFAVCTDPDTYFVVNEKKMKEDIKVGDRVKLYFDKIISIRYDNFPIKIVIDRSKGAQ